jgi:hypothetical protein
MLLQNPFSPNAGANEGRQTMGPGSNTNQNGGNSMQQDQNAGNNGSGDMTIPNGNNGGNNNNGNNNNNNGNKGGNNSGGEGGELTLGDDQLGDFKDLWQPDTNADGTPKTNTQTSFLPALDPTKLNEALGKFDVSKLITPEDSQAMIAGGQGAVTATVNVINKALRQSMATMYTANHRTMESAFTGAETRFLGKVPNSVKDVMTSDALTSSNAIMKNPAYAPMVNAVRQQFQDKYPKANPSEISSAVNKYFERMAGDLTKKEPNAGEIATSEAQKRKTGAPDANFEDWFTT